MKTSLIYLLMLFTSIALAVETCNHDEVYDTANDTDDASVKQVHLFAEDVAIKAQDFWIINLSKHLLKNNNVNINIQALTHLDFRYGDKIDPNSGSKVLPAAEKLSILEKVIHSDAATVSTLLAAREMCAQDDVRNDCELDYLNQKLYQLDPDNLFIYFSDLEQAVNNSDQELIDVVLKQMSQAKYGLMVQPTTDEFKMAVKAYLDVNPLTDEIRAEVLMELVGLELNTEPAEHILNVTLYAFYIDSLMQSVAYGPLSLACQEHQTDFQVCHDITEVMINHSDALLTAHVGHSIKEKLFELEGNSKALGDSQVAADAFRKYSYCLFENYTLIGDSLMLLDSALLEIFTSNNPEGKRSELAAVYLYEMYQDSGIEGLADPKSCGLRYVGLK